MRPDQVPKGHIYWQSCKKIFFHQFVKALLKIAVNRGMGLPFTKNIHEN
jgi:hypothetical protein